jgi:hypothetical protein
MECAQQEGAVAVSGCFNLEEFAQQFSTEVILMPDVVLLASSSKWDFGLIAEPVHPLPRENACDADLFNESLLRRTVACIAGISLEGAFHALKPGRSRPCRGQMIDRDVSCRQALAKSSAALR